MSKLELKPEYKKWPRWSIKVLIICTVPVVFIHLLCIGILKGCTVFWEDYLDNWTYIKETVTCILKGDFE